MSDFSILLSTPDIPLPPPPDLPVCSVIKEQTGHSRLMSDNPKHKRMTAKRTMQAHLAWVIFILSGEYQCPPDSVRSELAFLFRRPDEARGEQQSAMK